jgi:hypothetical protein
MGSRPSSFKRGGGFLNNVDATIRDYQFTDEFNGEPWKAGKIKDLKGKMIDRPHGLNLFMTFRVDGADEDTTVTLKAASNFDLFEVSDDGHVVTSAEGGECSLGQGSAAGKFLYSLCNCESGDSFPEDLFSDDPDSIDLSPMIGTRLRLVQRNYTAEELDAVKRLGASEKRKGKDGKEYNRQSLVVDQVYDLPGTEAKSNGKAAKGKPATTKTAAQAKGKKAAEPEEVDIKDLSTETLKTIAGDNDGKVEKRKLSMAILKLMPRHPQREDVRKWVYDDDNLAELVEEGVITYNKAKGLIELAE